MKKLLLTVALLAACRAADATPFGDFYNQASGAALKPFALDLGGILGGAAFHSARALGMPGFDIGVVSTLQTRPDRDDVILRAPGVKAFGLPMIQAEIGLPFNVDVIAHGISGEGATILGGGLRYGIHKSGLISPLPDVSISVLGDKVNQTYFSATHYSLNAAVSLQLPIVHPYLGVGYDVTKVTVGSAALPAAAGASATARGSRLTAGVDLSPLPFVHVYGAYTLLHGIPGVDLGLGVRF